MAQLFYQMSMDVQDLALTLAVKPLLTALGLVGLIVTPVVLGTLSGVVNGLTDNLNNLVSF
jgi:3-polyprenyl-4-hydroxybenzoate decarboxylase